MSEESSSTPRGLPTRPLHETLQPAVPLPPLLAKQNSNSDSNTSLDASTTTSDTTESGTSNQDPRPGFNGTWRTNSDVAERKVVMKQIVRSIQRRRPTAPESLKKQLPMMVKKMEEALYKAAPSMQAYADLSTLDHRLERLARKVQEQAAAMRQQAQQSK
ncbi:MAG: hypothetical protein SGBAC_011811 [Bacillariaceae sp.]